MKNRRKLDNLFSYKTISLMTIVLLLISLLPLLYCSFFTYATGDDLWEGGAAYHIIRNGGSITELFSAVFAWIKKDYLGWQGNWSSTFLWCFSPNVFGEKVYSVTPWIGILSICLGHWYSFNHFNRKYLGLKRAFHVSLFAVVTLIVIHYMPYIRGGIFWYSAMINYTFPYGLTLAIFVWIDKYLDSGKKKYLIFLILALSFLGGSGYIAIVLNFEVLLLVIGYNLINKDKLRKRRALFLIIPFILLLVGFGISAMSPGNAVRGGEGYGFDIENVFYTLKECIVQGAIAIPNTLWNVKIMVLILPFVVIGVWENLDIKKCKMKFRYPVLVVIFLFLVSCSVYAPGIYANDDLSGGVYDTIYFVFVLFYFLSVIYIIGYIKTIAYSREFFVKFEIEKIKLSQIRIVVVVSTLCLCVIGWRYIVNHSAYKVCTEFIVSGQLDDFEEQMQERLKILHDPQITEVVLPEMNDQQGPFMHMPLTSDPNSYTNYATAWFYEKDSVIAVPREEFEMRKKNAEKN